MTALAQAPSQVPVARGGLRRFLPDLGPGWWRGTVPVTLAVAAVLHLLWWLLLSTSGGDIAAQDAWAEFARAHPGLAYDLSWYGGMHPVSYSIISPYVMAVLGVRTTMIISGTVSAGLLAWLLERGAGLKHPLRPAMYGVAALIGNAISGRVTFALGILFALVAVCLALAHTDEEDRRRRYLSRSGVAVAGVLATASSPVAGLFLGLIAAAFFLARRRSDAYVLGIPPVVVVVLSALLFPFSGRQPMHWYSAILPLAVAVGVAGLSPRAWRTVRLTGVVYGIAVIFAWAVPSPIGTNVVRLGLIFGGVVLVAAAEQGWRSSPISEWLGLTNGKRLLAAALITATTWQVGVAARDAVFSRPPTTFQMGVNQLIAQLRSRNAELGRIEVVPTRNHSEASALAPYINLARGWNRQADVSRNSLFYKRPTVSADEYHRWLKRWAVSYVVISSAAPDPSSAGEAYLVRSHPDYLHEVWRGSGWTLYQVEGARPLVDAPAQVVSFDAAMLAVTTPVAGTITVRIPDSPWLALVDHDGNPLPAPNSANPDAACLSELPSDTAEAKGRNWVVLHAPAPGTYRISAPYKIPRGTSCQNPSS